MKSHAKVGMDLSGQPARQAAVGAATTVAQTGSSTGPGNDRPLDLALAEVLRTG